MRNQTLMLCLAVLAPATLGPRAATAQTASLEPGTRIRVTSTALHLDHVEGVVREIRGDTLAIMTPYRRMVLGRVVDDTAERDIPLDAVDGLQLPGGKASNVGRGAGLGTLIGTSAGFLMGVAAMASTNEGDLFNFGPEAMLGGAVAGGLMGLVAGTFIGALSSHDVWQDVAVPSSIPAVTLHIGRDPRGARTLGVGMALRF